LTLWLLNVAVGRAQTLPIVIDDRITVSLPDEVTFAIEASGDQPITSIVLTDHIDRPDVWHHGSHLPGGRRHPGGRVRTRARRRGVLGA